MAQTSDGFFPATSMPDRDWWTALWPDPQAVLRQLGLTPGMVAVDLCCGDGYFTAAMGKIVGGDLYGIDIDAALLEQTRAALARSGTSARGLICADARHLAEVLPDKVDYVLIANTFHGVPDQGGLARAIAEVLKPGGTFAIVNWHANPRDRTEVLGQPRGPRTDMRMSPEGLRAVVEPAGFRLRQVVELPPFHYGALFELDGG